LDDIRFLMKNLLPLFTALLLVSTSSFSQNGLNFDGSNDYVQTGFDGILGSNPRTIEAWIRPQFLSTQMVIADWGAMTPLGSRFTLNLIGGMLRCEVGGAGMTGTTMLADGQWHHVAVVYDNNASSDFTLYVDGAVELTYNLSVSTNTLSTTNFRIGRRVDNVNHFNGDMDEVRVWDYARSQTEIVNNMNAEFCSLQSGLVAYHKFNHGVAGGSNTGLTSSYDASGNGNNGVLNGFALTGSGSNWVTGYGLTTSSVFASISAQGCGSYISPSGNYTWTTPGMYQDTVLSIAGCDSVLTIDLSIGQNTSSTITEIACDSVVAPSGNAVWFATGSYLDTIPNAAGCDSIVTVDVVIDSSSASIDVSSCGAYTSPSGNNVWSISGFYVDTIPNAAGCDSILFITLSINGATSSTISENSCGAYTSPSGLYSWDQSGTYQDTLVNQDGCDSVITINLSVTNIDTALTFLDNPPRLMAEMSGANYQWINCSTNEAVAGAIGQTFNLPTQNSGSYSVRISSNGCTDTTDCYEFTVVGLASPEASETSFYPNPANTDLWFSERCDVWIYSASGQLMLHQTSVSSIDVRALDSGLYFVRTDAGLTNQLMIQR